MTSPRVLVVAGSDSGGGAGIQGDLKTLEALGVYGATALTAITVQNTVGVSRVFPLPPELVAQQIAAVLDDLGADAVKIGMLGDEALVDAVGIALQDFAGPIVLDPVMVAKGGAPLVGEGTVEAILARLLPRAKVVTPNVPELAALANTEIVDEADLLLAAQELLDQGPAAVLAKGGHLEGSEVADWLVTRGGQQRFAHPRQDSRHTHGTGCALASAVAAGLAQGMALGAAVERATAYVHAAIRAAPGLGAGHGPLGHGAAGRELAGQQARGHGG